MMTLCSRAAHSRPDHRVRERMKEGMIETRMEKQTPARSH